MRAAISASSAGDSCPRQWSSRSKSSGAHTSPRAEDAVSCGARPPAEALCRPPPPVSEAMRLSAACGGARIFLKREDLTHTGDHKINNALGRRAAGGAHGQTAGSSPKPERGSGVGHGNGVRAARGSTVTSTWASRTWSGRRSTCFRMRTAWRRCPRRRAGSRTLKDAIHEAMRDWVTNVLRHVLPPGIGAGPASVSAGWFGSSSR